MGFYLGLPEQICVSKRHVFAFILERLMDRLNSWSAKLLSKGGKEVLIKSVAHALPSYVMSCFLLPQDIIKKCLVQSHDSGGVPSKIMAAYTGSHGIKSAYRKTREVWDFEI